MDKKGISITANGESISINNPDGLESAIMSWQALSKLDFNLVTHDDCIQALIALVHGQPTATVHVSDDATKLIAKFLESSSETI